MIGERGLAALFVAGLVLVAGCTQTGTTTTGSTSSKIDLTQAATLGCALAQVVGATAGTVAGQAGAGASTTGTIDKARAITDTACAALIQLGGIVKQANSAEVSSTTR